MVVECMESGLWMMLVKSLLFYPVGAYFCPGTVFLQESLLLCCIFQYTILGTAAERLACVIFELNRDFLESLGNSDLSMQVAMLEIFRTYSC